MLVIVLIVASVAVVWAVPESQRRNLDSQYRSSHAQFESVASTIRETIFDASGTANVLYSSRTCRISIGTGTLFIKQKDDIMLISYTLDDGTDGDVKFDFVYSTTSDYLNIVNYTKDGNLSSGNMKITCRWLNATTTPTIAIDSNGDGRYTLNLTKSLVNTLITVSGIYNETPMAEAWILQVSSITHIFPSTFGTFFIKTANGGIITDYPARTAYVDRSLMVFNGSNRMSLYDVVLESTTVSEQNGIYDLTFTVKDRQADSAFRIRNLRFETVGDHKNALYNHFISEYGFQTDGNHIKYNLPLQQLDILRYTLKLNVDRGG
jgi:hypothetical protein